MLFRPVALAVALLVFLTLPSFVSASSTPYVGYIACGWRTRAPAATSCPKSGRIGAFFKSNDGMVRFKTCVSFPDGQRTCTSGSVAQQGLYYVNHLTVGHKGVLKIRWRVGGQVIASYSIKVT
jgi:hypothetical protein